MGVALHNTLAFERGRRGWTQLRLAEAAGISRQSYVAIEAGRSVPSTEVALRIARALGLQVEALFRLTDEGEGELRARGSGADPREGQRVRVTRVGGDWIAHVPTEVERPLGSADGVVVQRLEGGEVRVRLLPERPPPADLTVVGCDPAFGIVAEWLRRERGVEISWSTRGSRAAIEALSRGEAHVAGAHLVDLATGEVNTPWIRDLIPFPCTRVAFADWEQGLLLPHGNPAGIEGIADLARADLRFVNREAGSGSRLLLDQVLSAAGVEPTEVPGYATSVAGHLAVGEAVAGGLADAGVGIRAAGAAFGLDVLPLRVERYELIIPDHFLDLPAVGALLEALRRPGLRSQVEAMQGYDVARMGEPA